MRLSWCRSLLPQVLYLSDALSVSIQPVLNDFDIPELARNVNASVLKQCLTCKARMQLHLDGSHSIILLCVTSCSHSQHTNLTWRMQSSRVSTRPSISDSCLWTCILSHSSCLFLLIC